MKHFISKLIMVPVLCFLVFSLATCREWDSPYDPESLVNADDLTIPLTGGNGVLELVEENGIITITFTAADDDVSPTEMLRYQAYYYESSISVDAATIVDYGQILGDYFYLDTDAGEIISSDLTEPGVYYITVEVKDVRGNASLYEVVIFVILSEGQYRVFYDGNGGNVSGVPTDTNGYYPGDQVVVLSSSTMSRIDYSWDEWNTQDDGGGTSYQTGDLLSMPIGEITLYALWTGAFTITYDGNGHNTGSVPEDSTIYDGTSPTTVLDQGTLAREGYAFIGWNTESDGSGTSYASASSITLDSSITLYALWEEFIPTYTVTYNGNDHSGGDIPEDTEEYTSLTPATVMSEGTLIKADYLFAGWNDSSDGSGTWVYQDDQITLNSDVSLYAQWSDAIYVSNNGQSGFTGLSPDKMLNDIQDGIDQAQTNGFSQVFVQMGTFNITAQIDMISGISLYGGYSMDWSSRDPGGNTTTINDSRTNGITYVIYCSGISSSTVIDGFVINGSASVDDTSYGVFCTSSSPTIRNNTISGGSGASAFGIRVENSSSPNIDTNTITTGDSTVANCTGISIISGSPLIINNMISTGTATISALGINASGTSALPTITGNTITIGSAGTVGRGIYLYDQYSNAQPVEGNYIHGGSAPDTYGIQMGHTNPQIINNVIHGGEGTVNSYGMSCSNTFPDYYCNTIYGGGSGSSVNSYAIYNTNWARQYIDNNIIFAYTGGASGYGLYEQRSDGCEAESLWNNNFFDCITALYYDYETLTAITDVANITIANIDGVGTGENVFGGLGGNISVDPVFADADLRLGSSSPSIVIQGGKDLSAFTSVDRDGNTRTVPWSIGAYEYD